MMLEKNVMNEFSVETLFKYFYKNLWISDDAISKISIWYYSTTKRINLDYWNSSLDTNHGLYVGYFGRDIEILTSDIHVCSKSIAEGGITIYFSGEELNRILPQNL